MMSSEIIVWCQSYIANLLDVPVSQVDPDVDTADFGLDSAAAVALVLDLEAKIGRELDPAMLFEHRSLRALADALVRDGAGAFAPS